jgi:hypothetical protein
VAHFDLPYNTILGCSALDKFTAAVHYAYGTLKITGPSVVISINADIKGSVHCTERLYEGMAAISLDDGELPKPSAQFGNGSPLMMRPSLRQSASGMTPRRWWRLERSWAKNRKARSSSSSMLTPMCLRGNHRICPESPRR